MSWSSRRLHHHSHVCLRSCFLSDPRSLGFLYFWGPSVALQPQHQPSAWRCDHFGSMADGPEADVDDPPSINFPPLITVSDLPSATAAGNYGCENRKRWWLIIASTHRLSCNCAPFAGGRPICVTYYRCGGVGRRRKKGTVCSLIRCGQWIQEAFTSPVLQYSCDTSSVFLSSHTSNRVVMDWFDLKAQAEELTVIETSAEHSLV